MAAMSMASRVSIMTATSSVSVLPPFVAAEEAALVIEDDLVEIIVVVEERQAQRFRVALQRPRHEGADHEPAGHERRVRRRRQMGAMAHQRTKIAPVDKHDAEIAVPADHVQRVEREG